MAFSSNNLSLVRRLRSNFSEWNYTSTSDDPTVLAGAGYFNAAAAQLRVGDALTVSGAGSPQLFVVAGNAAGVVTVAGIVTGGGGGGGTVNNDDWLGTDLAIVNGGTGASDAGTARTNLGLGALATEATVDNADWSGTDLAVVNGGTGASDAATARTNLGLGALATEATIDNADWSGTPLAVVNGGTGAATAGDARTNLGLGTLATSNKISDTDWEGPDLAILHGGTGASSALFARNNLGLGALATVSTVNNDQWSGTDLTVANGGTGASDAATARINLGISAGSESQQGILQLATLAETNLGTDNTKAVSPDILAGSYATTRGVSIPLTALPTHDIVTGDGIGGFIVTAAMNRMDLISVLSIVQTAGTTGTMSIQVRRRRGSTDADMLSTALTIDSGELTSATAATPAVINGPSNTLNTGDLVYVDVDTVHGTPAKGGFVGLEFRLP